VGNKSFSTFPWDMTTLRKSRVPKDTGITLRVLWCSINEQTEANP
jgi:hypothetical protein